MCDDIWKKTKKMTICTYQKQDMKLLHLLINQK